MSERRERARETLTCFLRSPHYFVFPNGIQATRTRNYEPNRNLITSIDNTVNSATVSSYTYTYTNDDKGRRESMLMTGTAFTQDSFFRYDYNSRSERIAARRYRGTNISDLSNPVADQQFVYNFDNIGNRKQISVGTPPVTTTYASNNLNQYTVTIDPSEAFFYDDDGNMVADGTFTYTWNAENRLTSVAPTTPVANDKKLAFVYDYTGRRVLKKIFTRHGGHWVESDNTFYLYNGWNVTVAFEGLRATRAIKTYTWGLDLSQSLQGAGGVGGLLSCQTRGGGRPRRFYYFYDANGNVGQLINANTSAVAAKYEYKPFGGILLAEGDYAEDNPFRFSTKWMDAETGLLYYGMRYYSPGMGRWINRDPFEERGEANLLLFVQNDPVGEWDLLGLTWYGTFPVPPGVFPVHYLGRSGSTLYYPPGSDFNGRIRATPCSASFELAAVTSVLTSINYIVKNRCCEPKTYRRTGTRTCNVLPWHDPDLFLALNRYTISYKAEWTVYPNCCVKYKIKFEAYDIYDFSTFAKVALVGVPYIGRPFRIEWDWERKGGKCP